MNKKSSRLLMYAILFLAVLNVATLSTIGFHIYKSKNAKVDESEYVNVQRNYNGRYFRDKLQLTVEQMDNFRNVNEKFRSQARRINNELNQYRNNMMGEMQSKTPNKNTLNAFSDSIGKLHSDLKKYTYQYYLSIKEICTPEQYEELNFIFEDFFIGGMRHKGQQRHRYQWGKRN